MLLLMLTAREGRSSSKLQRFTHPANCRATPKSLRGIALVCLGTDPGARHSVKTGENAALLNRR